MLIKNAIILVSFYVCAAAAAVPFVVTPEFGEGLAPLLSSVNSEPIADSYIVVFKKGLLSAKLTAHRTWIRALHDDSILMKDLLDTDISACIKHIYDTPSVKGYSGKFTQRVLEKIRASEEVAYVERDSIVYASGMVTQTDAPWGLARLSHREHLTWRTSNKYSFDSRAGEGVTVYVIDTGINIHHVDFEGRAAWGRTIPDGDVDEDGNGHGSHVAGTIAGKRFGVAKKAKVVAVKVLRSNGSGTMSDVVAGVEWAIEQHEESVVLATRKGEKAKPSVANMSLGGGKSRALDEVVNDAVDSGIVFAVAAGNDNRNACDYSPAGAEKAITVGATSIDDERAYFSNHGKCLDVFAPGMNIESVWIHSRHSTNSLSGTSMASPHVAGLAAYFISLAPKNVTITPKVIKNDVIRLATKNSLEGVPKSTVNRLIYNNIKNGFYEV